VGSTGARWALASKNHATCLSKEGYVRGLGTASLGDGRAETEMG
jgi:hypothetical protein